MNVNLLQSNPDWRWYLLFAGSSLVLTGALWMASKFFPVRPFSESLGQIFNHCDLEFFSEANQSSAE